MFRHCFPFYFIMVAFELNAVTLVSQLMNQIGKSITNSQFHFVCDFLCLYLHHFSSHATDTGCFSNICPRFFLVWVSIILCSSGSKHSKIFTNSKNLRQSVNFTSPYSLDTTFLLPVAHFRTINVSKG